jgi:hypothetical protein
LALELFEEALAFDGFVEDGVSSLVHDASVSYAKNNHFNTNLKKIIHVHGNKGLASAPVLLCQTHFSFYTLQI